MFRYIRFCASYYFGSICPRKLGAARKRIKPGLNFIYDQWYSLISPHPRETLNTLTVLTIARWGIRPQLHSFWLHEHQTNFRSSISAPNIQDFKFSFAVSLFRKTNQNIRLSLNKHLKPFHTIVTFLSLYFDYRFYWMILIDQLINECSKKVLP